MASGAVPSVVDSAPAFLPNEERGNNLSEHNTQAGEGGMAGVMFQRAEQMGALDGGGHELADGGKGRPGRFRPSARGILHFQEAGQPPGDHERCDHELTRPDLRGRLTGDDQPGLASLSDGKGFVDLEMGIEMGR